MSRPWLLSVVLMWPAVAIAGPSVTVYSRDLGFVRETRTVSLAGGRETVRLDDVSERLDFASVRIAAPGAARVSRLAYRFDVASGDQMLERARGRQVRVGSKGDRITEGELLSVDGSWLVVRSGDGAIQTLARPAVEHVRLSNPPSDFTLRPTLEAVVEGGSRGRIDLEISYLTGGLSWSSEHTVVRSGETGATWAAAVTIENTTGRDYVDADVKLVAGEPRRTRGGPPMPIARGAMDEMALTAEKSEMSEESFAEYHLYSLPGSVTLRNREQQGVVMHHPRAIKVNPRYLYRGGGPAVLAQVEVQNSKANGLGVPLPGGRVRFYEKDASGGLHFTGETTMRHTAEGEKLTLDIGNVFDLAAERREVYNKRISDREREYQIEVKLRNRKKTGVTVVVEEPVSGDHDLIQKTHEPVRKDAHTLQFSIPVAAGKEAVLRYTVRARF